MKLKSIQMPKAVEFDESDFSNNYGKFVVQPLERGFGITLGNALRRTLLSSIQGAAIKSVRLDSVHHEFSVMQNIVEDVPEIILNLKQVNVKLHSDEDKAIIVEKGGPADLKAVDLQVDPEVEILNPDLHIATLGKDAHFEAEIVIGIGRGYVFAEENKIEDDPVGTITVDSLFSPIQKVNYHVENARVGQRTDYDKLTLEIWTNGTMQPDDALAFAAKILKDHLELFINFEEEPEEIEEEEIDEEDEKIRNLLRMSVDELELSVRSANCLRAAGIETLGDLVHKSEQDMLKYRNFGRKSLNELISTMDELSLSLGMDVSKYQLESTDKAD